MQIAFWVGIVRNIMLKRGRCAPNSLHDIFNSIFAKWSTILQSVWIYGATPFWFIPPGQESPPSLSPRWGPIDNLLINLFICICTLVPSALDFDASFHHQHPSSLYPESLQWLPGWDAMLVTACGLHPHNYRHLTKIHQFFISINLCFLIYKCQIVWKVCKKGIKGL